MIKSLALAAIAGVLAGCSHTGPSATSAERDATATNLERQDFAIAIHGGAGFIPRDIPPERRQALVESLARALGEGRSMLARGEPALDVVEHVVALLEDDPLFNAGRGAVFTAEGRNELDASIMEGSGLRCGGVAGVTTVRNPIRLARKVMMDTPHVLLARDGAERFADTTMLARVEPAYFFTEARWEDMLKALRERGEVVPMRPEGVPPQSVNETAQANAGGEEPPLTQGTVGCVALDRAGNLAAATSTGGLTAKRWGRVGDSPVIGAGTYADNTTAAVSCTGTGEEYIRRAVAYDVCAQMRYAGKGLNAAARSQIFDRLNKDVGGLIAVSSNGEVAMCTNTGSMPRAHANAGGRFEVMIWEEVESLPAGIGGEAP